MEAPPGCGLSYISWIAVRGGSPELERESRVSTQAVITAFVFVALACEATLDPKSSEDTRLAIRLSPDETVEYAFTYDLRSKMGWGNIDIPS